MKASRWNAADLFAPMLLFVGILSWGLYGLHGIDLVSEPFGSIMVLSRTLLSLAAVVGCQLMRIRAAQARQAVLVRARRRHG